MFNQFQCLLSFYSNKSYIQAKDVWRWIVHCLVRVRGPLLSQRFHLASAKAQPREGGIFFWKVREHIKSRENNTMQSHILQTKAKFVLLKRHHIHSLLVREDNIDSQGGNLQRIAFLLHSLIWRFLLLHGTFVLKFVDTF